MIKEEFLEAVYHYTTDGIRTDSLWKEVEMKYSSPGRHYHTLGHLDSLTRELCTFKERFSNWDAIVFAIAYHDIVYNTLKNNNEEKSAEFSVKRLSSIACPDGLISLSKQLILATKTHAAESIEVNMFTDADLSILGSDNDTYKLYAAQIRMEYAMYPDFMYNSGRKKVLIHFLQMSTIYKSPEFAAKYEARARINLKEELETL
jgi:predicted metal-dependent HD superfamily phosphohydrolase